MSDKRLTVVIPGYNTPEAWWERCIDSVCANIGNNDEIICVDDASSTKPVFLERIAGKDSRIQVVYRDEKGGPSAARNDGLAMAQGEYVTFIDSDDELLRDVYCKAVDQLGEGADIACFGVDAIWVKEKLHRVSLPNVKDSGVLDVRAVKRFLDNTLMYYVWNKVYRRQFLSENKLCFNPKMEMGEDLDFILRCVMAGAKWVMMDVVGINYYRTHATILSRYKPTYVKGIRQTSQMWKEYKSKVQDGRLVLGAFGETSEIDIWRGEWDNIWRLESPYTFRGKWNFLRKHKDIVNGNLYLFFLNRCVYQLFRKYFYFRQIQRWHIRRVYRDCVDL